MHLLKCFVYALETSDRRDYNDCTQTIFTQEKWLSAFGLHSQGKHLFASKKQTVVCPIPPPLARESL